MPPKCFKIVIWSATRGFSASLTNFFLPFSTFAQVIFEIKRPWVSEKNKLKRNKKNWRLKQTWFWTTTWFFQNYYQLTPAQLKVSEKLIFWTLIKSKRHNSSTTSIPNLCLQFIFEVRGGGVLTHNFERFSYKPIILTRFSTVRISVCFAFKTP